MPNFNSLQGLVPVGHLNAGAWNGQSRLYYVPSTDTNVYAVGDPVVSTPGSDSFGLAQVTIGVAGSPIRGVMVGAGVDPLKLSSVLVPSVKWKSWYIQVVDDPNVIFEIQEGGSSSYLTSTAVNQNANFLAATNNGYVSQYCLDNTTVGTSNTLNLKILGLSQQFKGGFGQYAKWAVLIMNHELV